MGAFGFENKRTSSNSPASFSTSNELQVGQVLDSRFKILEVVNRGGMAWIYKALDRQTGRPVALKVPLMQFECDLASIPAFNAKRISASPWTTRPL